MKFLVRVALLTALGVVLLALVAQLTAMNKTFAHGFTVGLLSHYVIDLFFGALLFGAGWYGKGWAHDHSYTCLKTHVCNVTTHIRSWLRSRGRDYTRRRRGFLG